MTQQSADQRREQVLAAAVEQFATGGLHGATTGQIAAAAGISQSYVMHLFGSKKGLFLAAVEEGTRRLGDLLDQAPTPADEEDAVGELASNYNALILAHPALMRLQLQSWAAATSDEEIRQACATHFRNLTERAAQRLGVSRADVSPLMAALTFFNVTVALDLQEDEDCAVATLLERIVPGELPAAS